METTIRSIVIVGGGTAGWMTATLLNRYLPASRCTITLVESADIGTIGVGEATVPPMVGYLRVIGAAEEDFLRQCHASYKLGIKFIDWHRRGTELWHPFGPIGGSIDRVALFHHWLRLRRGEGHAGAYADYSLQATLGDMGKAPRSREAGTPVTDSGAYAYHLDAGLFAAYLKRIAMHRGVRHVVDNVGRVVLDERGFIAAVETGRSGRLEADLYIDCTGFAALLIERALGDRWQSWSDLLLCDRALALPLPYDPAMAPYTRATALSAGWVWRIPLSERVGCGYVYSSRFASEDAALREFALHAGQDPERCEPRRLQMRVGRRSEFWVKNCVAVGLSAGFLEPLESTGLFLIQGAVERLLDVFPDRDFDPALSRLYNRQMGAAYDEVRDFIVLHYLLTRRDDAEFWRANAAMTPPASLAETLEYYDANGTVNWERNVLFGETSFYAIAAGFERLPRRHLARADYSDPAKVREILATIRSKHRALAESLPSHADYLRGGNTQKNSPERPPSRAA